MPFRPLHDRAVVRRVAQDEQSKGGIIIPDTAKKKPQEAEAIAVGPGVRDDRGRIHPLDVKVGDRVACRAFGTEPPAAAANVRPPVPEAAARQRVHAPVSGGGPF